MDNKASLTPRQRQIYDYMIEFMATHGYIPSQYKIAEDFEISQPVIAVHLAKIEQRGWIKRAGGMANGITIL
tara:strand:+ start:2424 stop:2639 length:216 start_codon:yes stop_codon:yes gene_type:complete